jgi:tetratricopeptide (TPR) repeat protein
MQTTSEMLAVGLRHHEAGNLQEAETSYRRILEVDPGNVAAWHLLGRIAQHFGRLDVAEQYIRQAVRLRPDYPEGYLDLGMVFVALGNSDEAVACYRRALELRPAFAPAHYNLGTALRDQRKSKEAIACFVRAIELDPGFAQSHYNLGLAFQDEKRFDEASACYCRAIELQPDHADAHYNLGLVHQTCGRLQEAADCYARALAAEPNHTLALNNLAIASIACGRPNDAVALSRRATELMPEFADAHNTLGTALRAAGKLDEALTCYRRAVKLRPDYAEAHQNLGVVNRELGRFDDAAACFRRAFELQPDLIDAHWNQSHLWLLQGDFDRGWPGYEWRWKAKEVPPRDFSQPRWNGEALEGKTIFLHAEQGFGDTLQFLRYAALVKERGGKVVVECQKPLLKLLSKVPGIDRLLAHGDELPPFDVHAPLLSLPGIVRTTLETIPANVPYLFAEKELVDQWRQRLGGSEGFRIGVNWMGRTAPGPHKQRDIRLQQFAALAAIPGARLISLQKDGGKEVAEAGFPIVDLGPDLDTTHGPFMDTAAIIMNLDLVITSDTSIPHLAGALGVPVWLALPFVPDWRWLLDRSDSPWYPTMRLFRQKTRGDWAGVFREIDEALRERLKSNSST